MAKTKHYRATINLLRPFFTGRPANFKIKIADGYIEMQNNSYIYWDGTKHQQLEQLDDEEGLKVFIYVEDNRFILEEFLIAENRTQENEWVIDPLRVTTENGETVGGIGLVYDEVSKAQVVLYLSAEGTATPITLWERGNVEERDLAIQDLKSLSGVILELINKLPND